MSNELDKLAQSIRRATSRGRTAQLRFATCTSVDWDNRTMEAEGVTDNLPYYGVMLGLGFVDIRPKAGTVCLIGILEGVDAYSFLINAEKVDEIEIKAEKITANGGENDGMVKIGQLVARLNTLERDLNSIKTVFKSWITAPNDGGAALKAAASSWAGQTIQETKQKDIENDKIIQ